MVVFVKNVSGQKLSAGIAGLGQPGRDLHRRRAELGGIDLVCVSNESHALPSGRRLESPVGSLALGGSKGAEVSVQHLLVGNKYLGADGSLANDGALVAGEEKHLVLLDRAADGAAELIALQAIRTDRKEVPRVGRGVAQELEQIPMQRVRAGLHHRVDRRAGVHPTRGVLRAGGDLELLQRVRERERHAGSVERIDVGRAVEIVLDPVADSAGNRNVHARSHAEAGRLASLDRRAG